MFNNPELPMDILKTPNKRLTVSVDNLEEANMEENSNEPPVNLFSPYSMGDVFNSVVNKRKYKNGDGIFSVWTHGATSYMADYVNGGGISTIEKFESIMEK